MFIFKHLASGLAVLSIIGYSATPSIAQPLPNVPIMSRYNTLPSPPPIPALQSSPPTTSLREIEFTSPSSSTPVNNSPPSLSLSRGYRVEVSGADTYSLYLVRQVVPTAFIRPGEGTIQAGLFVEEKNARDMVKQLQSRGLMANVITLESSSNLSGYSVVIPTDSNHASSLIQKVKQTGLTNSTIMTRESPRGFHVSIGPFQTRAEAESYNYLLRSQGIDSRVFFE